MPNLNIRIDANTVQRMERWWHPGTRTSVCSSVDDIEGIPTYHLSILGRKPVAMVLFDFDMDGAEEINVGKPDARHFWKAVA